MTIHSAPSYREVVQTALAGGSRFAGLYGSEHPAVVRAVFVAPNGAVALESVGAEAGTVPTIVDLVPAAGWDEREAHDLYGIRFDGHEPLRALVEHEPTTAHWAVPVHGNGVHQVAVGPIHAGVIESGHFRFHVVGERILHLDTRLFYKHRGLERAAEHKTLTEGARYVGRACAACAVANTLAYVHACEVTLGLTPTPELARARTLLLELERCWSHLNDIAAVCAGVGLAAGTNHFAALTDRARHLNAHLTGHRFLFNTIELGGSALQLDAETVRDAHAQLEAIRSETERGWRELQFNASFQDRLPDIGTLTPADIERLGTLGPAARAAGVKADARTISDRLAYPNFKPQTPDKADGDVRARLDQRILELRQTFDLLNRLLHQPLTAAACSLTQRRTRCAAALVESSRGATLCVVERDHARLTRVHLRTGSYANWPSVAFAAINNLLPDFPLINKSFELCYACADR